MTQVTTNEITQQKENIELSDTEVIENIKQRLGGKDLSNELVAKIIDAKKHLKTSKDKVQAAYRYAFTEEKLSKEEAKTIVAELMGVSLRTVEVYIPDDLKDPKYINNRAKAIMDARSRNKTSQQVADNSSPGTYNQDGKYGTATELETQTQVEQEPQETAESQLKRLSKPIKEDVEITVLGRTFKIGIVVDTVKRTVEPKYNEKEIARILKGSRQ